MLQPGRVLICPGNRHMKGKRLPLVDIVVLSVEARVSIVRAADARLRSAAEEFKTQAVGVLIGHGRRWGRRFGSDQEEGGMTIAQSEESCVVYGMPKAAIRTRLCHPGRGRC